MNSMIILLLILPAGKNKRSVGYLLEALCFENKECRDAAGAGTAVMVVCMLYAVCCML